MTSPNINDTALMLMQPIDTVWPDPMATT